MRSLVILTFVAGVLSAMWPIFMNKSMLDGRTSVVALQTICFALVIPFAIQIFGKQIPTEANWQMVIVSALFCGAGVMVYTNVLSKAPQQDMGMLMVLNLVTQIVAAAIYQGIVTRSASPSKIMGFATAGLTTYLLLR